MASKLKNSKSANSKTPSKTVMHGTKKVMYIKGVKHEVKPETKLSRAVINKTFKTDDEITEFILNQGALKDKITAMTLETIKEHSTKAMNQLLSIASLDTGGDKSYLAITHAIKIVEYYNTCLSEIPQTIQEQQITKDKEELENKEDKEELENTDTFNNALTVSEASEKNKKTEEPVISEEISESLKFVKFIEKTKFIDAFTGVLSKQLNGNFLKLKLTTLFRKLIDHNIMSLTLINLLMDSPDVTTEHMVNKIVDDLVKDKKYPELTLIKNRIIEYVKYHKNPATVKCILKLSVKVPKKIWLLKPSDYKEYIVPLVHGYLYHMKRIYVNMVEEPEKAKKNPTPKRKYSKQSPQTLLCGFTGMASIMAGLNSFIIWSNDNPTTKRLIAYLMKDYAYIIFKMCYYDNTKYSMQALTLLENISQLEKINYHKVLADTIRKYMYLPDNTRCELLNKAYNQPTPEVLDKVVKSAYVHKIGSKYPLGCEMILSEVKPTTKNKYGLHILKKSYSSEIASSTALLLKGEQIPVYNLWEE
ncbi:hypothetical protein NEOKW01_1835 [Nematocida sp. AWRm80]|nr:hypothetical protein NEOKW01_1835 [Nematocida sp. AWRm80]